ncbi:lysophospholipid acyltransferase family protein [Flavisphingomonas formosensis]|uniref:lysophospholipid acyltransferase family protein n=1 Tax=Flavisphingomonas formosensis TaxID=861534 RepID=UPI0012FB5B31|nr:lysophospholipid acyltransferase family protein [Sphingomonas formosensis]
MSAFLRSVLFVVVFYGGTVFAVLGALPVALLGRKAVQDYAHGWCRFHGWCAAVLLGIRPRVEGIIPKGPVLYAVKHQAAYETLELVVLLGNPAAVVKKELTDIPLWGWAAKRYGVIPIDRSRKAAALRAMLRAAQQAVHEGRPLMLFPEGTRVPPGLKPPIRAGFAGLYQLLGLPVVPVAVDSGRVWPRRGFVKRPGIITFRFGEPIPPGLPRREAEALVFEGINALEE